MTSGRPVKVRVWAVDAGKIPQRGWTYTWRTKHGKVRGASIGLWHVPRTTAARNITASVEVSSGEQPETMVTCEVAVTVIPEGGGAIPGSRGIARRTIRTPSSPPESAQYGLYSYVLLSFPPVPGPETERTIAALAAYFTELKGLEALAGTRGPSELNLTRIPLSKQLTIDPVQDEEAARATARAVLTAYDFEWARNMLDRLGQDTKRVGPYLVAMQTPEPTKDASVLVMNMSTVTPELARQWIRSFVWLTEKQRTWSERVMDDVSRSVQNAVLVLASETGDTISSIIDGLFSIKVLPK